MTVDLFVGYPLLPPVSPLDADLKEDLKGSKDPHSPEGRIYPLVTSTLNSFSMMISTTWTMLVVMV